jgi:hypothetical protein
MKTLKKILLIAVIVIVVLGIAAVVCAGLFLDKIIKTGIETVAPTITQTAVTVDSVNLSILSGSAGVNGMVIGNPDPAGYKSTNAISLGKAAVSVEPKSILSDKIVIHSIEVRAPEINLEGNPFGENNLKKLLDNVNAYTGAGAVSTNQAPPVTSTEKKAAKKLEVDDFLLSGIKVTARISGLTGEPLSLTIPDIHLTNLGTGADGITAADLTKKVLTEVITGTIKAVGEQVGNGAGKLINGTAGKAVGQGANTLKQGIGNLFGK